MPDTLEVIGLEQTIAAFGPERFAGFPRAIQRGGLAIEAEMKAAARPHHDTGNLERQIHTEGPFGTGIAAHVAVGIGTNLAPEGRPLAFGWKSSSGKQPPTDAIVAWLTRHPEAAGGLKSSLNRKGGDLITRNANGTIGRRGSIASISSEASVRQRAFLIARAIGRRGYSFGSGRGGQRDDWFHDGIKAGRPKLIAIVRAALHGPTT